MHDEVEYPPTQHADLHAYVIDAYMMKIAEGCTPGFITIVDALGPEAVNHGLSK